MRPIAAVDISNDGSTGTPSIDPAALAAALRGVRDADDPIVGGLLVAGADGMVRCAEACGSQVEMLGVMAAVVAGITSQIVAQAGVGDARACLFEGSSGHVAVFPLHPDMVLVVFGQTKVSTGRFNLAARGVLFRVREAVAEVLDRDGENPLVSDQNASHTV